MCMAYPYKVISLKNNFAETSKENIDLSLVKNIKIGDWVLVKDKYAVSKISEQEAKDMLELFDKAREAGDTNAC